jgi:hypothetical protein
VAGIGQLALVEAVGRWEIYCSAGGFTPYLPDGEPEPHIVGFICKTVTGWLLDEARRRDHVTRSDRDRLKALHAAAEEGARTEDELAATTGLSVAQIRRATAAGAVKSLSLDDRPGDSVGDFSAVVAEDGPETESQAAVNVILAAVLAALDGLDPVTQVVLALRFYREIELSGLPGCCARALSGCPGFTNGILAAHQALLRRMGWWPGVCLSCQVTPLLVFLLRYGPESVL